MKRREFIILGGAAVWPLGALAQQSSGMRRIGVLLNFAEDNSEAQGLNSAFVQALQQLGLDR